MIEPCDSRVKRRWLLIALVVVLGFGCARADWIEGTLVTVDVTGVWSGMYSTSAGTSGAVELVLQQVGGNVTGTITMKGLGFGGIGLAENVAIRGVVNGDVLRFNATATLNNYDLVVSGEQMLGSFYIRSNRGTIDVLRKQ
jgi:hypothetical protein